MDTQAKTLTVPAAGKLYFGLSASASYAAARRGEIPSIKIGRNRRVPIAAVEAMLTALSVPSQGPRQ